MAKIPPLKTFTIDGVGRGRNDVECARDRHAQERCAACTTRVTLSREGVGWKVTGIENDWRSTGG